MNTLELQRAKNGGIQYVLYFDIKNGVLLMFWRHYICDTPFLGGSKFKSLHTSSGQKWLIFGKNGVISPESEGITGFWFIIYYFLMNILNTSVLIGDKVAILPCSRRGERGKVFLFSTR